MRFVTIAIRMQGELAGTRRQFALHPNSGKPERNLGAGATVMENSLLGESQ